MTKVRDKKNDTPTPRNRKRYQPPRILEEEVFEREALIAGCGPAGACGSDKAPS